MRTVVDNVTLNAIINRFEGKCQGCKSEIEKPDMVYLPCTSCGLLLCGMCWDAVKMSGEVTALDLREVD